MSQLFQKAAVFTDIHLGLKNNSTLHLDDCDRYLDWFIAESKKRGAETCIFMGDWHHHRASLNIRTLRETIKQHKKLNDAFDKVYFIVGNHDLYFKDKRDLNSVEYSRELPNFVLIDEITTVGDVTIVPWLVADEWKKLKKIKSKYLFGHLELPYFKMNAMVEMPDHGGMKATDLNHLEYVFSGHFHKRQYKNNIYYIGNAFPHNYSDAGEFDRGCMFLEWGGTPELVDWPDCPKYIVVTLSQLLDNHATLLDQYTYAKVKLDINISYEEANFIREQFAAQYSVREIQLMPIKAEAEEHEGVDIHSESVDHIVLSQLESIESDSIDKAKLAQIYNSINLK